MVDYGGEPQPRPGGVLYNKAQRIDLNTLALFYQVANQESIRSASAALRIPNATLSRKLRELESDLGCELLKRSPWGVALTEAGTALYEHCERIMGEVRDATLALSEMQSELRGRLRISLPFGFGTDFVSTAIADFATRHPQVELHIQATHKWVDVTKEPFDIAINVGRTHRVQMPATPLGELSRGVYASPDLCRSLGVPREPADLADRPCIPLESQCEDGYWSFRRGGKAVTALPARITVTDVSVARTLAIAGLGFAILPNLICEEASRQGKLQRVLPDWRIPPLIVTATFVEQRYMPRRVRMLLDMIALQLEPLPEPTTLA